MPISPPRLHAECLQLLRQLLKKFGPAAALAPVPTASGEIGGMLGSGDDREAAARLWAVLGPLFGAARGGRVRLV